MSMVHATPRPARRSVAFAPNSGAADGLLAAAILAAGSLAALEPLGQAVWARWAAGGLDDEAAQNLNALAVARRAALKGLAAASSPGARPPTRPPLPRWRFPAPKTPRRPDRATSLERRRRLAASGPMPPALAAGFTTGELAALKIVADEIGAHGDCRLALGAVAARAGVSETTARNALRAAARAGLVRVEARPRRGLPNLTNVVRMISADWRAWLARRPRGGEGAKDRSARSESLLRPQPAGGHDRTSFAAPVPSSPERQRTGPAGRRNQTLGYAIAPWSIAARARHS